MVADVGEGDNPFLLQDSVGLLRYDVHIRAAQCGRDAWAHSVLLLY